MTISKMTNVKDNWCLNKPVCVFRIMFFWLNSILIAIVSLSRIISFQ